MQFHRGLKLLHLPLDKSLEKLGFVADYEGRSVNSHILVLIRENIRKFEEQNGEITGSIRPDVNVKPTRKY